MKNILKKLKSNQGFSILEIMAATVVITIGLTSMMTLSSQSLKIQNINKQELIASQLAQEGMELVRNIRDMNWILEKDWAQNLSDGNFIIDYTKVDTSLTSVFDLDDSRTDLYLDGNGFYQHSSTGTSTIFSRMISISKSTASTTVTSTVKINNGNNTKDYAITSVFYDWR